MNTQTLKVSTQAELDSALAAKAQYIEIHGEWNELVIPKNAEITRIYVYGTATVGSIDVSGTVTGSIDVYGTATGSIYVYGTVTGSIYVSGTVTGSIDVSGTVTGSIDVSGTAKVGSIYVYGTAKVGSIDVYGTVTGSIYVYGTVTGSIYVYGTATVGSIDVSGTVTGSIYVYGTVTGSIYVYGTNERSFFGTTLPCQMKSLDCAPLLLPARWTVICIMESAPVSSAPSNASASVPLSRTTPNAWPKSGIWPSPRATHPIRTCSPSRP